jgi:hypothetical protein
MRLRFSIPRRRSLLIGLLLCACKTSPEETSDGLVAKHRDAVTAKLKRLAQIAAEVEKAPPLTEKSTLRDPGVRLVLCHYVNARYARHSKAGPVEEKDSGPCNMSIIHRKWLLDWKEACKESLKERFGALAIDEKKGCADEREWNSVEWFVETASLIETGTSAFTRTCNEGPNGRVCSGMKLWPYRAQQLLDSFLERRFVLVKRASPKYPRYDSNEVFFYDTEGPKALGGFRVSPIGRSERKTFVFANGPNKGKFAYSTSTEDSVWRAGMNAELLKRLKDVVVGSTY